MFVGWTGQSSVRQFARLAPVKILVIGSGAREHALTHSLVRSHQVWVAPGNPGTERIATNVSVDADDGEAVAELARELEVDLVVVGPEAPLVVGVASAVRAAGIPVFGPDREAAQLEGSKAFAKEIMAAAEVPTARPYVATSLEQVKEAFADFGPPYVVKDDGLAAGKGVVVTDDKDAALAHARMCLAKPDGRVVIEEFLDGPEISLFCLTDGQAVVPLAPAQDFKRLLDADAGPNTGGMGAYSPLTWAPADLTEQVVRDVAQPTIDELARRDTPFVGLLYCGLALTSKGLRVIEFNARFGDPETQVVLARLQSDLGEALYAAATGTLADLPPLEWNDEAAVTVVLAAAGYPESPRKGDVIHGLDGDGSHEDTEDAYVLHAGTATHHGLGLPHHSHDAVGAARTHHGATVTAGGRVLSVVGLGANLAAARERAYARAAQIDFEGAQYRRDIAAGQE